MMVCYLFPTAAMAMIFAHRAIRKKKDLPGEQLNLLLGGGAIFGIVDHAWNGQLALIGKNVWSDIALGVFITVAIYAAWFAMMALSEAKQKTVRAAIA
jgi:hypothetical protein